MREIDELRPMTALRLLEIWRETRETAEDPLERALLCNARVLAECCRSGGEQAFAGEMQVLKELTGRQMEDLLLRLAEGGGRPAEKNAAFDMERFCALRGE